MQRISSRLSGNPFKQYCLPPMCSFKLGDVVKSSWSSSAATSEGNFKVGTFYTDAMASVQAK